jgi:hypothetical protein
MLPTYFQWQIYSLRGWQFNSLGLLKGINVIACNIYPKTSTASPSRLFIVAASIVPCTIFRPTGTKYYDNTTRFCWLLFLMNSTIIVLFHAILRSLTTGILLLRSSERATSNY